MAMSDSERREVLMGLAKLQGFRNVHEGQCPMCGCWYVEEWLKVGASYSKKCWPCAGWKPGSAPNGERWIILDADQQT